MGLLLFAIYTNDINWDLHIRLLKFAVDTKLFEVVHSVEKVDEIREYISKLYYLSSDQIMMFNIAKCKVMYIRKSNKIACYVMG